MKGAFHRGQGDRLPARRFKEASHIGRIGKGEGARRPRVRGSAGGWGQEGGHGLAHHAHPRIMLRRLPNQHSQATARHEGAAELHIGRYRVREEHAPEPGNQMVKRGREDGLRRILTDEAQSPRRRSLPPGLGKGNHWGREIEAHHLRAALRGR